MPNAEFHFKTKIELLKWHEKETPASYSEYIKAEATVKEVKFPGSVKLLRTITNDQTVDRFLAFLTELNLANLLLLKKVTSLHYEPVSVGQNVDFSFDDILVSVKNVQAKNYEKSELAEIQKMTEAGGGEKMLRHKEFSDVSIEVQKTALGAHSYTRLETGAGVNGFLSSDLSQMEPPLKNMGEFDAAPKVEGFKKVLFIAVYSEQFKVYHAEEIASWYYDSFPAGFRPILSEEWYMKLFGKERKSGSIDALVFMFPPNALIWSQSCFAEEISERTRLTIYTKNAQLKDQLKNIFS
ncbi:MAG: hypothetical protein KBD52_03420 [Candidatus Pacebacteria bacterium]|nr:hypothetical protein [Candidatus Paceibacterota bacterium]